MKVIFLVNGQQESAAGTRAQAFASRLPADWQKEAHYRPARKWKGILPFVRAVRRMRPDVIYVMDTAYTGVVAGCLGKRLGGARLAVDTGDAAFELAKSSGNYSAAQLALIRWVENLALHHADAMVTRGSYHREMLRMQGVRHCVFIPDGVDLKTAGEQGETESAAPRNADWQAGNPLTLGMVGSMNWSHRHQMCYGWDVVEALGLLRDAPVRGLLVGDGDGRAHLEKRARELGVSDRIVFAGAVPFGELPRYLAAMDVCLSTQSNDIVGMVRTTGKLPLYLAHDKYVIATDVGEARHVLPGVGCLLPYQGVHDTEYPARVAAQIRLLLANGIRWPHKTPREVAAENFDYDLLAGRVERLCCDLQNKP